MTDSFIELEKCTLITHCIVGVDDIEKRPDAKRHFFLVYTTRGMFSFGDSSKDVVIAKRKELMAKLEAIYSSG